MELSSALHFVPIVHSSVWLSAVPGYITASEGTKEELCILLNSDIWRLPFLLLFLYTINTCLADNLSASCLQNHLFLSEFECTSLQTKCAYIKS